MRSNKVTQLAPRALASLAPQLDGLGGEIKQAQMYSKVRYNVYQMYIQCISDVHIYNVYQMYSKVRSGNIKVRKYCKGRLLNEAR